MKHMQDINTLKELGFQQNIRGTWFWRGKKQKFTASLGYDGKFIELFLVSNEIDNRPHSSNKGFHFKSFIKDCCSIGSVEKALKKYDVEESKIIRQIDGVLVL